MSLAQMQEVTAFFITSLCSGHLPAFHLEKHLSEILWQQTGRLAESQ